VRLNELLNAIKFTEASSIALVSHSNMFRALLGRHLHPTLRATKPDLTRDAGALKLRNCALVRLELDFTQDLGNCIMSMEPLFVNTPSEAFEQRPRLDRKASVTSLAGNALSGGLSSMRRGRIGSIVLSGAAAVPGTVETPSPAEALVETTTEAPSSSAEASLSAEASRRYETTLEMPQSRKAFDDTTVEASPSPYGPAEVSSLPQGRVYTKAKTLIAPGASSTTA